MLQISGKKLKNIYKNGKQVIFLFKNGEHLFGETKYVPELYVTEYSTLLTVPADGVYKFIMLSAGGNGTSAPSTASYACGGGSSGVVTMGQLSMYKDETFLAEVGTSSSPQTKVYYPSTATSPSLSYGTPYNGTIGSSTVGGTGGGAPSTGSVKVCGGGGGNRGSGATSGGTGTNGSNGRGFTGGAGGKGWSSTTNSSGASKGASSSLATIKTIFDTMTDIDMLDYIGGGDAGGRGIAPASTSDGGGAWASGSGIYGGRGAVLWKKIGELA